MSVRPHPGRCTKIDRPYDFLGDVYQYEQVGAKLGLLVAIVLPWFEIAVGACLLTGTLVGGALVWALGLSADTDDRCLIAT